jgi:Flp pilus assembly protein TadG
MDKQRMKAFLRDERGSTIAVLAASMVMVVGFTALGVDAGYLYAMRSKLQATAAAAALAGASQLPDPAAVTIAAMDYAGKNMPAADHGTVLTNADVVTGSWDTDTRTFTPAGNPLNAVRVIAHRSRSNGNPVQTFFARVLGFNQVDVEASAIAASKSSLPLCILALGVGTTLPALEVSGSAVIDAPDCHIQSNQSGPESISVSGSGSIMSDSTCAVGGIVGPEKITPAPKTDCDPIPDPMAGIPEPSYIGCDFSNFTEGKTANITPGVYCGGINLKANGNITMAPGLYIMDDGDFKVPANATVTGDGVTIYFSQHATSYMNMIGGPNMHLTAPTTGTYAGIVVFGSRTQPPTTRHTFIGNDSLFFDGAIYLPSSEMYYQGNSLGSITVAIADRINVDGNSTFQRDVSSTFVPLPSGFPGSGASGGFALVK